MARTLEEILQEVARLAQQQQSQPQPVRQTGGLSPERLRAREKKLTGEFNPEQRARYLSGQTTPLTNPVPVPTARAVPTPTAPTAPDIEDTFVSSVSEQQKQLRARLDETFKNQKADVDKKLEAAQINQAGLLSRLDPEKRDSFDQEKRITQNQLDAAESASSTLQSNFEEKQRLVGELENLLTQGNAAIEQQKRTPVAQRVLNVRVNNTVQDVAARAGVINAVLAARDGQIAQAHNLINQSRTAVEAQWNDHLQYYETLLAYNDKDIVRLSADQKRLAEEQTNLLKGDLARIEKTSDYLKNLMIDPDTAQFIADAGVKLTDSIEEINNKMSAQAKIKQVLDIKKELVLKGYTPLPYASSASDVVSFDVGGQRLYFRKPPEKTTSSGGRITSTDKPLTIAQIEQFRRSYKWTPPFGYTEAQLLQYMADNPNATPEELEAGARAAIGGTVAPVAPIATREENEAAIREVLSQSELKKLSDWAGTSRWWRTKSYDINAFFAQADEDQLDKIKQAVDAGYSIDEIIAFLK